jgi:hypothetical protein
LLRVEEHAFRHGNVDTKRLLDPRLLDMESPEPFPILGESCEGRIRPANWIPLRTW